MPATIDWVNPKILSGSGSGSTRSNDNDSVLSSTGGDMESERSNDGKEPAPPKIPTSISKNNDHLDRLVQWNFDLMIRQIRVVLAKRASQAESARSEDLLDSSVFHSENIHPRDEYSKVIELPRFDAKSVVNQVDPNEINLEETVKKQLLDFVTRIGASYHQNPFHNFEVSSNLILRPYIPEETSNNFMAKACHTCINECEQNP